MEATKEASNSKDLKVIRDPASGYPNVQAMLEEMADWTAEEKFNRQN